MKSALVLIAALFQVLTFASPAAARSQAPSQDAINRTAFAKLISNASRLHLEDGKSVSMALAVALSTGKHETNRVSNTCAFDQGDEVFKCSLVIHSKERTTSTTLESQQTFSYELERDQSGLPSEFFDLTVRVAIAG